MSVEPEAPVDQDTADLERRQRNRRNLSIAIGLGAFVVIVFAVTIIRLGGAVAERSF